MKREMRRNHRVVFAWCLAAAVMLAAFSGHPNAVAALGTPPAGAVSSAPAPAKRPMQLADILAWKNINTALVSNDGRWFAYRLSPIEGDSEVLIRQTQGDKQYKFGVGDIRGDAGGGRGGAPAAVSSLAFSEDSKWAAFSIAPTRKEAAQLRRQRRPLQNKVALINLETGTEVRFDKVRRFAFSGEKATWIALLKYGPEGPGGGAAPAAAAPVGGGTGASAASADDRPKGADVVLHELATGAELNVGNVADFAFDKTGKWLAFAIDAQDKSGNGLDLRNLETGATTPLDSAKASYERITWTEKGDGLAALKGVEDKRYKDKVYAVVAFSGFATGSPQEVSYDPAADKTFPDGMSISPARSPQWTEDLSAVTFGIRTLQKADPKPEPKTEAAGEGGAPAAPPRTADEGADEEKPDLVIWHWQDPRLQSQQQVQEEADKNFSYLSTYRVKDKKFIRLADDQVRSVTPAPKDRWAIGIDVREYELEASLSGRRYQDVYAIDLQTGARKLALKKAAYYGGPSADGTKLLYYEDGHYFVYDIASGQSANITKTVPTSFINSEDDHNVVKPPQPSLGWTKDGDAVLLSDGWDIWKVPMSGAAVNLTVNGRKEGIRYRRILRLDPEEKGFDLSAARYIDMYGEYSKKGGVARLEPGKTGVQPLLWDEAAFGRVAKAKSANLYLYTRETYKEPPDYYVTDAGLAAGKKITALDKQVDAFDWTSGSQIVDYTAALGKDGPVRKLQASLFLPANYQKGKSYPTLVYIYEKLSQEHNRFVAPTANGFNKSVYTSNGYAVLQPDITYRVNDPGMSAVWCVLPALKAAIATGVVDAKHVGLQGHSWGGYQTAFLVTQTNMFAAAVAGAPLTNMVSMYSLIYKNSGGTNQAIFETSQGRFRGGYWDNWDAYYRNSPVNFAKNVTTPLIILHNDKDGAVDFTQGVEYYNTLRRLGKKVVMLEYPGENHGLAKPANQQDYTARMKEFFDHELMGEPAPDWWTKGVSRLEMDEHIRQRLEQLKKAKAATAPTKPPTDR
jgi:dipeptidyl aminopeptidase/acylaminoacyl peptidase